MVRTMVPAPPSCHFEALEKSDDEAPRQRLMEMAKKLADSKLKDVGRLRHPVVCQKFLEKNVFGDFGGKKHDHENVFVIFF